MSKDALVYSTDGGGADFCPTCGLRRRACRCPGKASTRAESRLPNDGVVRLLRDRKGRGGKTVTLVAGVPGTPATREELATALKRLCGSGGGVKDDVIEIQGDHRLRLAVKLAELGYRVKIAGG